MAKHRYKVMVAGIEWNTANLAEHKKVSETISRKTIKDFIAGKINEEEFFREGSKRDVETKHRKGGPTKEWLALTGGARTPEFEPGTWESENIPQPEIPEKIKSKGKLDAELNSRPSSYDGQFRFNFGRQG